MTLMDWILWTMLVISLGMAVRSHLMIRRIDSERKERAAREALRWD